MEPRMLMTIEEVAQFALQHQNGLQKGSSRRDSVGADQPTKATVQSRSNPILASQQADGKTIICPWRTHPIGRSGAGKMAQWLA